MKMLFVNVCDMQTIKYDFEDGNCWRQSRRLNGLNYRDGVDVCLYGFDSTQEMSLDQYLLFNQVSDWAHLHVTNYKMEEGFYPLLLTDNALYFTDQEEFSHFDGNWAAENVYKMPFNNAEIQFQEFQLTLPAQTNFIQKTLEPCNLKIKEYFDKFVSLDDQQLVSNFCNNHQQTQIEVIYDDRYLKTELSLIICIQFIKDLLTALNPVSYNVTINGASFEDFSEDANTIQRLWYDLPNSVKRDEIGSRLADDSNWTFNSADALPHHRELQVHAGGNTLRIMPDAGLAYGWKFDRENTGRVYFGAGQPLNPEMPIVNLQSLRFFINVE